MTGKFDAMKLFVVVPAVIQIVVFFMMLAVMGINMLIFDLRIDKPFFICIINTLMIRKRRNKTLRTRAHRELFTHDSPYGHKIQKDKSKTIPRKQKHKPNLCDE